MRDYYSGEKAFAKTNVLSTEETCKILGRSRQQLNNLIKNNNIEVFKALSNSNLFWRPEVYELLRKLNREKSRVLHEVYGYSTSQALEAFYALNIDKEKVEEVYVFFYQRDAISKNFYNIVEIEMPNTLTSIEGPRFVIVMEDGEEYWFEGLTCGYAGTGCHGTETVLSELGILVKQRGSINSIISDNRMIHFFRNDDRTWNHVGEPSIYEEHRIDFISEENLLGIEENLYRYNGCLVLTQGARFQSVYGGMPEPSKEVLFKSLYFVPNPVSVEFLSEKDAINTGHYQTIYGETVLFQIVIKDISDRELWLNYPFEKISQKKQHNMRELLTTLGVQIEEQSITDKFLDWLNLRPRNIYRHYEGNGK